MWKRVRRRSSRLHDVFEMILSFSFGKVETSRETADATPYPRGAVVLISTSLRQHAVRSCYVRLLEEKNNYRGIVRVIYGSLRHSNNFKAMRLLCPLLGHRTKRV